MVVDVVDINARRKGTRVLVVGGVLGIVATEHHTLLERQRFEVAIHVHVKTTVLVVEVSGVIGVLRAGGGARRHGTSDELVGRFVRLVHGQGGGLDFPVVVEVMLQVQVNGGMVIEATVPARAAVEIG